MSEAYTIRAGIGLRSAVRARLESAQFQGADIEWIESKSLLNSWFTVKGHDAEVVVMSIDPRMPKPNLIVIGFPSGVSPEANS